ncbi:MAG: M13 family peptidase, partial [Muribaculaceae bacterium]|nr:M13 family peptidase [Muribaculaceae bacterium]
MKKIFLAAMLALSFFVATAQINKVNMDLSVKPGDDFWQYAVGGWLKANPLDKQHVVNGAFVDLGELNNTRINELIMKYAGEKLPQGTDGQKIGTLYRLYMDSVSRNTMGFDPIKPYLKQVRDVQTREELFKLMYELDAMGFNATPFGIHLSLNPLNSSEYIIGASHGGTSLPQEFYANPNAQQQIVVNALKEQSKDFFKMVGYSNEEAEKKMQAEWNIEHQIGITTLDQVSARNPMLSIHFMSWEQLLDEFKGIDWVSYRDVMGYPTDIDTVNVAQLEPLHVVENILATTPLEDLKSYVELCVIGAYSGFLSDDFTDRMFETAKTISGVQEQ